MIEENIAVSYLSLEDGVLLANEAGAHWTEDEWLDWLVEQEICDGDYNPMPDYIRMGCFVIEKETKQTAYGPIEFESAYITERGQTMLVNRVRKFLHNYEMLDCQKKFMMPIVDGEDVEYTCPFGYAKIAAYIDGEVSIEDVDVCERVRKSIEDFCPLDNNQKCHLANKWGK